MGEPNRSDGPRDTFHKYDRREDDNRWDARAATEEFDTTRDTGSAFEEDVENVMTRAQATLSLTSAWFSNFSTLAQLELDRTLSAGKRIAALSLILLPLAFVLFVSLCGGLGLLGYYFSQSIYVGFAVFLFTQVLLLAGIAIYINQLRKLLGFEETKRQAREALNDVTEFFK
ncbi:hypothetical protein [Microbulbifer aggregans]|uniref:hypothetical protein n=1 Tax=Microbulbifer aggregans TaxID=1769779 RepID=UPI001CFC67B8|nr:hypothetical protein [Microbulbifer aggregans]